MVITVVFEVTPPTTGRSTKRSPSNFAIDQAQETKYYTVKYNFNPTDISSRGNDQQTISSALIKGFVSDFLPSSVATAVTAETQLTIPIEDRFYRTFPLYIGWLEGKKPALALKEDMVNSLQLAF